MWKVIDYFNQNPNATAIQAISYYEEQFESEKWVRVLKEEGERVRMLRSEIRPLLGEKMDVDERLRYALSEIEGEVYIKYPPRGGTEAQREAYRIELKAKSEDFQGRTKEMKEVTRKIVDLEDDLAQLEKDGKNARRLLELLEAYIEFINVYKKTN